MPVSIQQVSCGVPFVIVPLPTRAAVDVIRPEKAGDILNLQGVKLGRPSWIHTAIESSIGAISRVHVGGTSVFVAEGAMEVEV